MTAIDPLLLLNSFRVTPAEVSTTLPKTEIVPVNPREFPQEISITGEIIAVAPGPDILIASEDI
ncbi:MAG TPA: hypothetical protein VK737_07010 [Opitutales bacterium]|jgi:hypothetical protein|nr:hypothetical protein [Opitutales bacterium]